ncbi:MAG: cytochrome P450, partial [Micromonosporaceae bacterium]
YMVDSALRSGRRQQQAQQDHLDEWMRVRRDVWRSVADRLTRLHVRRIGSHLEQDLRRHAGRPVDVVGVGRAALGRAIVDFCIGGAADPAAQAVLCTAADDLFSSALRALVSGEGRVGWLPRPAAREASAANQRLLDLLDELVRDRYAADPPAEPRDLLDVLVADGGSVDLASRAVLVLRTIMFASHGVPGAAFSWIALLLAEHPGIAAKVASEASGTALTDVSATSLPYTTAVVKEALRLQPPQWLITRTSTRPMEVGGYELPAGTEVLVCPYLMHRDPRCWDDPDQFDPQRWLGPDQPHARHAYIPFGAGPRVCPGSRLAMVQVTLATAMLARDYRLEMPSRAAVRASSNGLLLPIDLTGSWHQR